MCWMIVQTHYENGKWVYVKKAEDPTQNQIRLRSKPDRKRLSQRSLTGYKSNIDYEK